MPPHGDWMVRWDNPVAQEITECESTGDEDQCCSLFSKLEHYHHGTLILTLMIAKTHWSEVCMMTRMLS